MQSSLFRHALVLGLVSAIGPFAIDMYLPALPEIGHSLSADIAQVQLSLTVFFLALGLCQLLYGRCRTTSGASRRCTSGWRCSSPAASAAHSHQTSRR